MKIGRASAAGESRSCPHCSAKILKSAVSCPICHHMLRVNTLGFEPQSRLTACPLLVEGTLQNPGGDALEYQVLMEIRNDSGKLLSRQIIDVGAVNVYEKRIFSLRVEMSPANSAN
jgi:hypothetical protein